MDEEDPVVQEIPVYLSQALSEHLYIYQYPVRPANRDWKDIKVINASIKPKNQLVRMEIGLDTYSEKYCPSKGEQIALNTDGPQESKYIKDKEKERSQYFRNGIMDKIVYESSSPCLETKHYAVAILQDKELHCTPIKGICQLRPSYSYFDKQDKRKIDKSKAENSDDEEKESEPQQVTVKFSRAETDVAKKAREKSYESISQKIANEPWYDAFWRKLDDDHADLERLKLFSSTTSDGSALTLGATEYINTLVPSLTDEAEMPPVKKTSLQDQIKEILLNAKLMTFNELRSLVRNDEGSFVSESALLAALGGVACCVRGLWTARSQQMYTRPAPAPPRLMCAARDHVLYLFTQHSYVDRRKIAAAVRLPAQEVLEILRSVAKLNPQTGWELLLPPDSAFEAKYPEVIQRQNLYWEACQRQFNEMLIGENLPKRQRKKSQRDSISSDSMLSPRPRNYSVSEDDDRKRKIKMASGSKRTRNMSSSSAQDAT
ncbi:DNA-directed RNA polymerase III subunit RPC5 [Danaus plexippus]|uniref:DNA-directed RNA polymerase 3 subunit RPC5 n=1 Tax=Danaus plexippus plexippus TaxID=278856 RepID=A0A212FBY7_DANPL|nr:DNA-directed RNA polymerase III subunit RPC5 [Danaus plexippus]OWR51245.1 DNA-directed RNA polymerase 3 subunit RPC5 [Danaus plexippus plexippus]